MIGRLQFNIAVSNSYDVGDCITVHLCLRLHERSHLPLRVLMGELLLIHSPCADDGDVILYLLGDQRHKPVCAHLHPPLSRIGYYKYLPQRLGSLQQLQ